MGQRLAILVAGVLAMFFHSPFAAAQPFDGASRSEYIYEALLDTDSNEATGGPVTVVQGSEVPHDVLGIDYIVRVGTNSGIMDTVGGVALPAITLPVVSVRDVLRWNSNTSSFDVVDCNHTVYPLGISDSGGGLVEFGSPLTFIGDPLGTIRAVFHASTAHLDQNDYTAPFFLKPPVAAPAMSVGGLGILALLLMLGARMVLSRRRSPVLRIAALTAMLCGASLAWATNIAIDGSFADWNGIPPIVSDPPGDSSIHDPAEDILNGYAVIQGSDIFFRLDLSGLPTTPPC